MEKVMYQMSLEYLSSRSKSYRSSVRDLIGSGQFKRIKKMMKISEFYSDSYDLVKHLHLKRLKNEFERRRKILCVR